jgi:hypothetical protein
MEDSFTQHAVEREHGVISVSRRRIGATDLFGV